MKQEGFPRHRSSPAASNWKESNQVDRAWYQVCGKKCMRSPESGFSKWSPSGRWSRARQELEELEARRSNIWEFLMWGKHCVTIISKKKCKKFESQTNIRRLQFLKSECSFLGKKESFFSNPWVQYKRSALLPLFIKHFLYAKLSVFSCVSYLIFPPIHKVSVIILTL